MKAMVGWIVALIVIIGAGAYYFMNNDVAPATNDQAQTQQEQGTELSQGSAAESMSGMWQSNTDAKFTREIRPDGVMIDRYEGDMGAGTGGEWSIVNPAMEGPIAARASALSGMTVVKVVWDGGVETTYFAINKLDDKAMTTTDISGTGSVTTYTKVMMTP